ncbi:MAG: hypothetical protein MGG11_11535 [Trichodesmium sp. MAG_R03]|nr:hypothetical protein [Trichodesmium sp. MAG_R03]
MVKNRKLSRPISDLGWRQFRTLLEGKAEKWGREFRVLIDGNLLLKYVHVVVFVEAN